MQDNSTNDLTEQLIKYIDDELPPEERAAIKNLLQNDEAVKERYENLVIAKGAVRSIGLQGKVRELQQQYLSEANAEQTTTEPTKIIKPAFNIKRIMQIAAVFIIAVIGYGLYEYSTTNNTSVYAKNFISYQLPVARGGAQQTSNIDSLYRASNYTALISAFTAKKNKTQKDNFLAGLAYLQTNNAAQAINALQHVQQLNNKINQQYFTQETDYYLLLAYIKANNINAAQQQLNFILANVHHSYYQKAKEISKAKLIILKWKQ